MSQLKQDIERIFELDGKRTASPWEWNMDLIDDGQVFSRENGLIAQVMFGCTNLGPNMAIANTEFIASAPLMVSTIRALLNELKAAHWVVNLAVRYAEADEWSDMRSPIYASGGAVTVGSSDRDIARSTLSRIQAIVGDGE